MAPWTESTVFGPVRATLYHSNGISSPQTDSEKACLANVKAVVAQLLGMEPGSNHFSFPVAKSGIPGLAKAYSRVIPKQDHRDLATIHSKLEAVKYSTAMDVNADMRQV